MVSSPGLSPARGSTARKVLRFVVIEPVFGLIVIIGGAGLVVVAVLVVVVEFVVVVIIVVLTLVVSEVIGWAWVLSACLTAKGRMASRCSSIISSG